PEEEKEETEEEPEEEKEETEEEPEEEKEETEEEPEEEKEETEEESEEGDVEVENKEKIKEEPDKRKEGIKELVGKISSLEDMMEESGISEVRKVEGGVDVEKKISKSKDMIKTVEGMIYWAEEFDINTEKMQDLLLQSKDELEMGDWDSAMEYAQESMDVVFDPMKESLNKEISKATKELREMEVSGKDVSELRPLIREARLALHNEDLGESIDLIKKYKEKRS
ncbi:MAG: hypothetical protein ACQESD_06810, partial [Thermoplasmatota archaeon]